MDKINRKITGALLRLLEEKNYDELKMQDIIAESKVSRGCIYKRFRNKDSIAKYLIQADFSASHTPADWMDDRIFGEIRSQKIVISEYAEKTVKSILQNIKFYNALSLSKRSRFAVDYLAKLLETYYVGKYKNIFGEIDYDTEQLLSVYAHNIADAYAGWICECDPDWTEDSINLTEKEKFLNLIDNLCPRGLENVFSLSVEKFSTL